MKIEHIALYVNDLEASHNFFVKYFDATSNDGYCNPKTNFRSYFLSFDGGARLELMSKPEMSDPPKNLACTGYAHIAFRVGSREKVDALTAALQADGYESSAALEPPATAITKAASLTRNRIRSRSRSENDRPDIEEGNPIRLYTLAEITDILASHGMEVFGVYADFDGTVSSDQHIQLLVCAEKN